MGTKPGIAPEIGPNQFFAGAWAVHLFLAVDAGSIDTVASQLEIPVQHRENRFLGKGSAEIGGTHYNGGEGEGVELVFYSQLFHSVTLLSCGCIPKKAGVSGDKKAPAGLRREK